ncbi:MAG: HU family DNA-binding protein [Pseudomonadota bacterium]
MNKSELVAGLTEETSLPLRKSEEIVNAVLETLFDSLVEGNRIEIRGFGSFEVREYPGYTGRNPKTGQRIQVEGKRLPFFKAGKELRNKVNQA